MKVWNRVGMELTTPGSAVRHVTDYARRPGISDSQQVDLILRTYTLISYYCENRSKEILSNAGSIRNSYNEFYINQLFSYISCFISINNRNV